VPTVTAKGNHVGLCRPFLVRYQGGDDSDRRTHPVDEPLPVQDTSNRYGVCQPFILPGFGERKSQAKRTHDVEHPMPTVCAQGHVHLAQPFIMDMAHTAGQSRVYDPVAPMPTLTTTDAWALARPFITSLAHTTGGPRNYSLEEPLRTQTGTRTFGFINPFIVKYYGTAETQDVDDPLHTITAKARFGVAAPMAGELEPGTYLFDILYRMMQPHELAAAMSFPADYEFLGTKSDRVKQIGNAVPVKTAAALCGAILDCLNESRRYRKAA
jgi:DNA (cytosine-5)-methyltransferase 1